MMEREGWAVQADGWALAAGKAALSSLKPLSIIKAAIEIVSFSKTFVSGFAFFPFTLMRPFLKYL